MQFNAVIATSVLAFCAGATAYFSEGHEYGLYARDAEPEDGAFEIDYLHPRDAYQLGVEDAHLYAREADKKADLNKVVADKNKGTALWAQGQKQRAEIVKDRQQLAKAEAGLANIKGKQAANDKEKAGLVKKLTSRSLMY